MANNGKDTIVAIQSNGAGTWGTAETIGASDGILPTSIDQIQLQGTPIPDESIGMTSLQYMDLLAHEANPTITLPMRWNGAYWGFIANWLGDDTVTGPTGNVYTHTMNYQETTALTHITLGIEVNNADIIEFPSLKVQQFSLEPDGDGFWQLTANCLGNTVLYAGDATFDGTAADNVTYATKTQRMRYRALSLKVNSQGSDPSGQTALSVAEAVVTGSRPYDTDRTLAAVATGAEKHIDEPVQNGHTELTFGFNEPTYSAIADFDDFQDETEKTMDFQMAETIGSDAHTLLVEFGAAHPIAPSTALERGQRIPMTKNYRLLAPQSAATGQATANPIHLVLGNLAANSYETTGA